MHDLAAFAAAWMVAFWLRFNLEIPEFTRARAEGAAVGGAGARALFWIFGLYRGIWRFASLPDLQRILLAVAVGALAVPRCCSCCKSRCRARC